MSTTLFAKDITAEDLRTFLSYWPTFSATAEALRQEMKGDKDKFLGDDAEPITWCYLFDFSIKEHLKITLASSTQNSEGILDAQQLVESPPKQ